MEELKVLLEHNASTMKTFIQLALDGVQKQLKELRDENCELKKSLEFSHSEVLDLKSQVQFLKKEVHSGVHAAETDNRIRALEDHNKRKNLKLSGVTEQPGETAEQTLKSVETLIKDKLNQQNVQVFSAFRVGSSIQDE